MRTPKKIIAFVAVIALIFVFCYWQNNDIVVTRLEYSNSEIPDAFDGSVILQVSDLHNKQFGDNQSALLSLTKKISPDMIVITGDLIDSGHTDIDTAMDYVRGAVLIAPVYFVTGNHEVWSDQYGTLARDLIQVGVTILENSRETIQINGEEITLIGLADCCTISPDSESIFDAEDKGFSILLSHRPELFEEYAKRDVDLVFSGHAHGGQFRVPYLLGAYSPDQGLLPEYTSGMYIEERTTMAVSRGLGNSVIPVRIFNRPELIVVTLHKS